jgi:acyl-coenzyme A thioesterase 13
MNPIKPLEAIQSHIGKEFTISPSPFTLWLKPKVLHAERGKLSFQYKVRKEMTNPLGTLHGGVTAAIMDDVIGATMYSLNEEYFYTTINNVVDYFAKAREHELVIADTCIIKKGNQIVNAQFELWNEDKSRLIARGYSNLFKTDIKK